MYSPKGNGKDKAVQTVEFVEAEPPAHLQGIVHRYLELKTIGSLAEDYRFHALPDACTYLVFDRLALDVVGVSRLRAESQEFNLGREFHFVNVRFLPGVWQGPEPLVYGMVKDSYTGKLPLIKASQELSNKSFAQQQEVLSALVEALLERELVAPNRVTALIFKNLEEIHTVADMAEASGLSTRQLQRTLQRTTGFAPHDFLKVLRLQQALNGKGTWAYADQAHFINSFRRATGYTPGKYSKIFDV